MYRIEWPGHPGVEFHLSHGDWIRLLRRSDLEVEDLIELRPAAGASSRYPFRHSRVGPKVAMRRGVEGSQNARKIG